MGSPMGDVSVWLAYGGGFCIDREIAMDGGCYEFAPEGGNRNASPPGGHMGPPVVGSSNWLHVEDKENTFPIR